MLKSRKAYPRGCDQRRQRLGGEDFAFVAFAGCPPVVFVSCIADFDCVEDQGAVGVDFVTEQRHKQKKCDLPSAIRSR